MTIAYNRRMVNHYHHLSLWLEAGDAVLDRPEDFEEGMPLPLPLLRRDRGHVQPGDHPAQPSPLFGHHPLDLRRSRLGLHLPFQHLFDSLANLLPLLLGQRRLRGMLRAQEDPGLCERCDAGPVPLLIEDQAVLGLDVAVAQVPLIQEWPRRRMAAVMESQPIC